MASTPTAAADDAPKTIILGFDGMDHDLTRRFMDEGLLPNLKQLGEQGVFQPLGTSNPAQSNVAWAVFNTGQNPGKTGLPGFVGRQFSRDANGERTGPPRPRLMLGDPESIPADEYVTFPMALENPGLFAGLAAAASLVVIFLLFRMLAPKYVALALGLVAGAGGFYLAMGHAAGLPPDGQLPYERNPMQGTNFWTHLDSKGVRLMGVQVASTFPPDNEGDKTRLLSGLGVKDIGNSPGSWYVYTDDPWTFSDNLSGGGKLSKFNFETPPGGSGETQAVIGLPGPKNWIVQAQHGKEIAALEAKQGHKDNTAEETARYAQDLKQAQTAFARWKRSPDRLTSVSVTLDVDRSAGTVAFNVEGERFTLKQGEWSDYVPVTYVLNDQFKAYGIAKFHLQRLDDDEVRIFVPPVNIDPYAPLDYLPISSPPGFAAEIAEGIGDHYETLGWACMTNPLKVKDAHFTPQSFLDDIVSTMHRREDILAWAFDNPASWDVYYQVFSTPDRVGHMLMREFDEGHPAHDAEYAATEVTAWERSFPLSAALPEVYMQVDRIVGGVLERIDAGDFGDNCWLVLVADHGFTSFRRGVNLNNLLYELGYLVTLGGKDITEYSSGEMLTFVDWEQTRAYSMGLGKVFINLKGREPLGLVPAAEYDDVVASIREDLLAVTDGEDGPRVFSNIWPRDEIFEGPWVKEGQAELKVRGETRIEQHDGFADLFVGYAPTYRVSWDNTLGGVDKASIVDNTNHWSGDHVSLDPAHVAGIFFCNRPLDRETTSGLIDIGPTVLARYGVSPDQTDCDGKVLPIDGLGR